MSAPDEIASLAREAAADAAWRQWGVLGAPIAASSPAPRAVIDPEALLLLSAALRSSERRLDDVLAWWAASGSTLLSVQRTTTLLRRFPTEAGAGIAAFAVAAVNAGDGRWSTLARAAEGEGLASRGKRGGEPRLATYPALMLRLRAGFGVGVKADLLTLLLALRGQDTTVRALSNASGYTPAAIRRAAQEVEAAAFLRRTQGRPAAYHTEPGRWTALLGTAVDGEEGSGWRAFAQVFTFLAWVGAWSADGREDSTYLAASVARDLFEAHRPAFELNRISVPDPRDYPGASYLDAFTETVRTVSEWLSRSL